MDTEMKLNVMSFRQLFKFLVIGILALLLFACASNSKNLGEIDDIAKATFGSITIETLLKTMGWRKK